MNICISIAEHELEMAHRWFDFVSELGGTDGHYLYLIPASGVDISALIPKSNKAFGGRVAMIKDEENQTSDWQSSELVRSAAGPNSAFRQVAWHFYHANLGPYFWCELDCIPLTKDWLDRLETEYKSCGKPFMGAHVLIEGVQEHMSGNAIYLNPVVNAPTITMRTNWTAEGQPIPRELAFDVAGSPEVIPKAHWTNLIQHKFRFKGFESRSEFDAVIDPNAVVFHSDKKGTIYKYLRENLSGNVGVASRHGGGDEVGMGVPPAQSISREEGDGTFPTNYTQPSLSSAEPKVQTSGSANVVSKTFTPSDELEAVIQQNSVIKNGLPAMSPPWENREDSERDVKMICDTLALFAKAPIYKSRVRQALREAKIIK